MPAGLIGALEIAHFAEQDVAAAVTVGLVAESAACAGLTGCNCWSELVTAVVAAGEVRGQSTDYTAAARACRATRVLPADVQPPAANGQPAANRSILCERVVLGA